jgi:uncharacterized protein YegP (UPF0339 family)
MAATFEVYRGRDKDWRWRLRHQNGRIIAESGEGYKAKVDATHGIDTVKTDAPGAPVVEQPGG